MSNAEDPRPTDQNNLLVGFAYALLAVVLWSGNFIAAKALHNNISPIGLAFFRWLVATLVMLPIAYQSFCKEWKIVFRNLKYISFTALMGVTLFNTLVYVAGQYTTATNLALVGTTSSPIFVLLISGLILRQLITANQVTGAVICVAGILVLISGGNFDNLRHLQFSKGDAWVILAALTFAIYTVMVRKKPKELSTTAFLFSIFLIGTIFILPAFLWDNLSGHKIHWDKKLIGAVLYVGIGASVISFLAWNKSIQKIGPTRAALFGNLIPVFSTVEAALILNEKFTAVTVVSFAIIMAGLAVANMNFFRARPKPFVT